jgi:hypothetical protein
MTRKIMYTSLGVHPPLVPGSCIWVGEAAITGRLNGIEHNYKKTLSISRRGDVMCAKARTALNTFKIESEMQWVTSTVRVSDTL